MSWSAPIVSNGQILAVREHNDGTNVRQPPARIPIVPPPPRRPPFFLTPHPPAPSYVTPFSIFYLFFSVAIGYFKLWAMISGLLGLEKSKTWKVTQKFGAKQVRAGRQHARNICIGTLGQGARGSQCRSARQVVHVLLLHARA